MFIAACKSPSPAAVLRVVNVFNRPTIAPVVSQVSGSGSMNAASKGRFFSSRGNVLCIDPLGHFEGVPCVMVGGDGVMALLAPVKCRPIVIKLGCER